MARLGNLDYEAASKSDLIPPGTYEARIVSSDIKATKDGNGKMLVLEFDITVQGRSRKHWERLNVVNSNPDTVRIATRQLMQIAKAVSVPVPVVDSEDLHNKPMMVTVAISEGRNGYEDGNKLSKFAPWTATGGRAPAPAASGGSKPSGDVPW